MTLLLACLLQVEWAEGVEASLARSRERLKPLCLLLEDGGAASQALAKALGEDPDVRKFAPGYVFARAKATKLVTLLDLPFPALAVIEPALARTDMTAEEAFLRGPCRGRLTLAGELTPEEDTLVESFRTVGRGGSQRIGPMPLESCFSVVGQWARSRLGLAEDPFVLDPSIPKATPVDFEGGPDHTFESILRAFAGPNRWVLYPRGGKIVLSARLPRTELGAAEARRFLAAYAEPEAIPEEERRAHEQAVRELAEDDPAVREAARRRLAEAGSRSRRVLRKALAETQDPDARPRLETLLRR